MVEPGIDDGDMPDKPMLAMAGNCSADPDTMYYHEAISAPDAHKFVEAMSTEMEAQSKSGNFRLMHRSNVPEGATILPSVWTMKHKRRIKTQEVYK